MAEPLKLTAPLMSQIRLADTDLNLVLLSCPGVRYEGERKVTSRDFLAEDIQALLDRGVRMLICCLTDAELSLGVDHYARSYAAAGIDWQRVVIPDMSPPPPDTDGPMDQVCAIARKVMAGGQSVAIHCMAGLGRTGTVAARLIIDYGLSATEAIAFVRAAHSPAAIETRAQELYLVSGRSRRTEIADAPQPATVANACWRVKTPAAARCVIRTGSLPCP